MSMTSHMGHHGCLPALALQAQAGASDHPAGGTSVAFLGRKTQLPAQENQGTACATGLPHRHAEDTTCLKQGRLRQNLHLIQTICQSSSSEKSQEHKAPQANF